MKRITIQTIVAVFLFLLTTHTSWGIEPDEFYIAEPPWWGYYSVDEMDDSESIYLVTYNDGVQLTIGPPREIDDLLFIDIRRNDWEFPPAELGKKRHRVQVRIGTDEAEFWEWRKAGGEYDYTNNLYIFEIPGTYDRLKRAETFTIRLTPMSGSSQTIVFPISGLAEAADMSRWKRDPKAEGAYQETSYWEALDIMVDTGEITEGIREMFYARDTWYWVEESFLLP